MNPNVARLLLRLSIGYLMVIWGVDKLANPAHGLAVSNRFYFGLFTASWLMPAFGVLQMLLGLVVMTGKYSRYTLPMVAVVTGMTLLGVWRSIVDPWGWFLTGSNALFYPSLVIFAAVLVLWSEARRQVVRR